MDMLKRIKETIKNPWKIFYLAAANGHFSWMPDKLYLKCLYRGRMGKRLNLNSPETFNEKLQWLKLYNRKPEYTMMVDKYLVRDYIARTLGEDYLIPLIGIWKDPDEINFDELPNQFVLKCNHNSGLGMCICKDKSLLDIDKAKEELRRGIAEDYFLFGREWPYKNVERKIICEKYMCDSLESNGLTDYKFFCMNGVADSVMVCLDRFTDETKYYFFSKEWRLLRLNIRGKNAPDGFTIPKPSCMDAMFKIAETLSVGIPFVRVDLYECDGKIYFGELTFFPQSGFDSNLLNETDEYYGKLIKLER